MKTPNTGVLKRIFAALRDDISRKIYGHRLLFSLLEDKAAIQQMVHGLFPETEQTDSSKICCYGAGGGGVSFIQSGRKIPFIVDKYKTGDLCGIPVISLHDFLDLPDHKQYLLIVTVAREDVRCEIERELNQYGLQYILGCPGLQYFDLKELNLGNEYFVDAGALDGNTTKCFLSQVTAGHVYAFEPNPKQFERTRAALHTYPQVELLPYGLFDRNDVLRFDPMEGNAGSARCSESGSIQIEVRKLDDLLGSRKVTFLKMDIEGSELAALRGAERIIREQRPKLAICVYHKPEDLWEIPSLLLSYHPDYKLYLRHYSINETETILYAI